MKHAERTALRHQTSMLGQLGDRLRSHMLVREVRNRASELLRQVRAEPSVAREIVQEFARAYRLHELAVCSVLETELGLLSGANEMLRSAERETSD